MNGILDAKNGPAGNAVDLFISWTQPADLSGEMTKSDLIGELLKEQEQVILGLEELNTKIEAVLRSLAPPQISTSEPQQEDQPGPQRKAA